MTIPAIMQGALYKVVELRLAAHAAHVNATGDYVEIWPEAANPGKPDIADLVALAQEIEALCEKSELAENPIAQNDMLGFGSEVRKVRVLMERSV